MLMSGSRLSAQSISQLRPTGFASIDLGSAAPVTQPLRLKKYPDHRVEGAVAGGLLATAAWIYFGTSANREKDIPVFPNVVFGIPATALLGSFMGSPFPKR